MINDNSNCEEQNPRNIRSKNNLNKFFVILMIKLCVLVSLLLILGKNKRKLLKLKNLAVKGNLGMLLQVLLTF